MTYVGKPIKLIQYLYEQDKEKIFEIKEYKQKRNNDQNRKYWKLLGELSLKLRIGIEELHFNMLKNYSQRYEICIPAETEIRGIQYYERKSRIRREDGKEYDVYHVFTPSHELNTNEFSALMEGLCEECKQQGIETRSPDEILRDNQLGGIYEINS